MAASQVWPAYRNRARPKGTFELNLYLFPVEDRFGRDFVRRALHWLRQMDIVDGYYDVGLGWHAPGLSSWGLIDRGAGPDEIEPGTRSFEYLIVHEGPQAEFIPNAHTGPFGALCSCGASLEDAVHEYLASQCGVRGLDAQHERIRCSACGRSTDPAELQSDIETAVATAYLNFCHLDSDLIAPPIWAGLERLAGCGLRKIRERL